MNSLLIRRRAMMNKEQSYVDWLKSIGCVVWLPLSEEGDLQDRISGLSLALSSKGSMTWDASQNMYKIYTPNVQFQYVALLNNGLTKDMFTNNCLTTMSTFKKITTTQYGPLTQFAPLSTDDNTIVSMNPLYNATGDALNYPTTNVRLARVESEQERLFYQNGALYTTISPTTQILPRNWVQTNGGLMVGFVRLDHGFYKQKEYYIKDIYIFNTKLTLEQIRKIQGYE